MIFHQHTAKEQREARDTNFMSLDFRLSLLCEAHNVSINSDKDVCDKVNALLGAAGVPPYVVQLKWLQKKLRHIKRIFKPEEITVTMRDGFATLVYRGWCMQPITIDIHDEGYEVTTRDIKSPVETTSWFDDADSVADLILARHEEL